MELLPRSSGHVRRVLPVLHRYLGVPVGLLPGAQLPQQTATADPSAKVTHCAARSRAGLPAGHERIGPKCYGKGNGAIGGIGGIWEVQSSGDSGPNVQ